MLKNIWNKRPGSSLWIPQNYDTSNDYYLDFDKVNDSVLCQSVIGNSVYDPNTSNAPFSINIWVYCKSNGESTLGAILHKGHNNPTGINVGYQMHVFAGNATRVKLGMNVRHGDGSDGQQCTMSDNGGSGNGSLLRNQWRMVTMVYNGDGDKRIRAYVQGVEVSAYTSRTAGTGDVRDDSAQPLFIGNKNNGTVTWDGYIRDAKFFHNYALSQVEITALVTNTVPASLSSFYDFHEGRGFVLHDIVGGGHGRLGSSSGSSASPIFTPGASGNGVTWGIL